MISPLQALVFGLSLGTGLLSVVVGVLNGPIWINVACIAVSAACAIFSGVMSARASRRR